MTLKKIIKIADYYDIKYCFDKSASSEEERKNKKIIHHRGLEVDKDVTVKRDSGKWDSGWKIGRITDDGQIVVYKKYENSGTERRVLNPEDVYLAWD